MKNKPSISVIVPIYNVEKYLPTCIESIQNQTLKNLEIILVDDGTPDRSGIIADEYSKIDERIKVIHKLNGGLSSARNEGILMARGKYISFVDSDDWIEPNMLESMYNAANKNKSDIVVSGVIVEYSLEKRKVIYNFKESIYINSSNEIGTIYWQLEKLKLSNYAWNKIYKNSFVKDNGLKFIDDAMPAEDLFFNLTAFAKSESIAVLNEAFYHYLNRDKISILSSYQNNLTKVEAERIIAYKAFFKHFKLEGEEFAVFINRLIVVSGAGIVMNLYRKNAPHNRKERILIISDNIFNNINLKRNILNYSPQNVYEQVFVFLYRFTNPILMEFGYSFLFFMRRKFVRIYLRFRINEQK